MLAASAPRLPWHPRKAIDALLGPIQPVRSAGGRGARLNRVRRQTVDRRSWKLVANEHHPFPDLPAQRYPEIAPPVRAPCEWYGLPYEMSRRGNQYPSVLRQLFRLALGPGAPGRLPTP